ncbi:dihydrofolate reductase family protein [Tunturiibacter empetritectus]|uniref:Dihydrofolate reductase n=1 Tax=Tunturiibacter lichenicola TaxID=2051959 RepID=A0A852VL23_9BACT|nr:dihydrofolate reductase family protein [Edaphobacter lichenicola]NYF90815.1 dihydrofolate reductase [Edaphobacter lichenicola]
MRRLMVFNISSVDGYIADANGDMSWARQQDKEWNEFTQGNAKGDGTMLFGRKTYDLMAGFWPTSTATAMMPEVAERMNSAKKVVFSRSMESAGWKNTTLVKTDPVETVRKMKAEAGEGMVIFGSGTLVAQLTGAGLIDEYQIAVMPVVLGGGKTMFEGLEEKVKLTLTKHRVFGNGSVLLHYEPTKA